MVDVSAPHNESIEVILAKLEQFLLAPEDERPAHPDIPWPPRVEMLNEHGDPLKMICEAQATRVLHSAVTEVGTAVIFFEKSDWYDVGHTYRSWLIRMDTDGVIIQALHGTELEAKPWTDSGRSPLADFGFRFYDEQWHGRALLERARLALLQECDQREPRYDPRLLEINDDLIYVPYCWIGCAGWLIERRKLRAWRLGSQNQLAAQVWAYYQGCDLDGEGANDLVVTSVNNWEKTEMVFRGTYHVAWWSGEEKRQLQNVPARFHSLYLYHGWTLLYLAQLNNWFRFEIQPPTPRPPKARNQA